MELTYHLEGVIHSKEEMADFEGPLNLILMLLSKNRIEIRDIRISEICDQYMTYLEQMESMDMEVTSEFVQMAAQLLYIKTRMLLGGEEEVSELEVLIQSLEQLKARDQMAGLREQTDFLLSASQRGMLLLPKPPEPLKKDTVYRYRHASWELLRALDRVYARTDAARAAEAAEEAPFRRLTPRQIVYNVREKSQEILDSLRRRGFLSLKGLYADTASRSELVAAFLSVLELCSMGALRLSLDEQGGVLLFLPEKSV